MSDTASTCVAQEIGPVDEIARRTPEACKTSPPLPDEELPPLPDEQLPPLPDELPPENDETHQATVSVDGRSRDDGWQAILDKESQQYYFYNTLTKETTWDNPRINDRSKAKDPNTIDEEDYSMHFAGKTDQPREADFAFQARFDRRTGRFVSDPNRDVENYTPDARADRQMSRFFDANLVEDTGMSLKAERRALKHSKQELQMFREKQKAKKEQKRRAWLTQD